MKKLFGNKVLILLTVLIIFEIIPGSVISQVSTPDSLNTSFLNWYNMDEEKDGVVGSRVYKVYDELLKNKEPKEKIIVAVIDCGIDVDHEDLKGKIWINDDEIPDNGIDDDKNDYIDDIHGWNYIGTHQDKEEAIYEILAGVRVFKELDPKYEKYNSVADVPDANKKEYELYLECKDFYERGVKKHKQTLANLKVVEEIISHYMDIISTYLGKENPDYDEICKIKTKKPEIERARNYLCEKHEEGLTKKSIESKRNWAKLNLEKYYNIELNSRSLVGDDVNDISDTQYGNNDVTTTNYHGSFVAGIIAANRNNGIGIDGIAESVEIMCLKVVPNGDEHDKDVALSIRYAVDNGARIINMSFGKMYSINKPFVDDAVKYAEENDVLLVHAAGNDASDLDKTSRYPTYQYNDGTKASKWIDVGAHSKKDDKNFSASFTNYGQEYVDLFAPGVKIISLCPYSKYVIKSGTSFSCPTTAGIAALILSYYPDFSAMEVKEILMESCRVFPKLKVYVPGSKRTKKDYFFTFSKTGGIVDAFEAMKLAEKKIQEKKVQK